MTTSSDRILGLWDLVEPHIRAAHPGIHGDTLALFRVRFITGAIEHGDDWLTWTDDRFQHEIDEELADLILYRAMRAAAHAHQGATTTNQEHHE